MSIGRELLNVPMGDMIRQMAFAIAEGQTKLDASSIEVAEMMGGLKAIYDDQGKMTFQDSRIFFGYDLMTVDQADSYLKVENAIDSGSTDALDDWVKAEKASAKDQGDGAMIRVPTRLSMLELGFTPTFYQFIDTIIEVKITIKITRSSEYTRATKDTTTRKSSWGVGGGVFGAIFGGPKVDGSQVSTSQVDASYASKYSYSAEGSSLLRTKLVPLPPPPVLEERIRLQMEADAQRRQKLVDIEIAKLQPAKPV